MKYVIPIRIPAPRGVDFTECESQSDFCNKISYNCGAVPSCAVCMYALYNIVYFEKWIKEVKR